MKVALVGLPQSGKSTLYAAATGQRQDPFAAPAVHRAVVKVPDPRLDTLAQLYNPKKYTEATIEFHDVPGISLADAAGVGEFRRLLPDIRACDVLMLVLRDFHREDVPAYKDRVNPEADFAELWGELIFADLDAVTTRVERLQKSLQKPSKTHDQDQRELNVLLPCKEALENERPLSTVLQSAEDRKIVASFGFLTEKPLVAVRNVSDDRIAEPDRALSPHARHNLTVCAAAEAEIAALDPAERGPFLADLGIEVPAKDRLLRACYESAGLISFLTMGPDEVRAWPIPKGATAVEAAGRIHSDLARGFIRAETVAYDDLVAHHDLKGARAAGKVRQEGKTYVVSDGDILNIKFNV
ncbi:MAG: ribosome-binding ATPase YchF [Planctomycetota bacterium]|nr:MAG: ribosome-binding ATPase YchF [Planctomycetota bacterium]